MTARRALTAASLALSAALILAGCSGSDANTAPAETAAPAASAAPTAEPAAPPAAEATPEPTAAEKLTCAQMIPESVATALTAQGWTATESAMYAGSSPILDSLVCTWAPAGSFAGQMYGVGRVTDAEANQLRSDLNIQGWVTEESSEGVYYSAPVAPTPVAPSATPGATSAPVPNAPSANMAGFTYLFGDGWVKYSDTRDGLLLIVTPVS